MSNTNTSYPQTYSQHWNLYFHPHNEKPVGCGYYYIVTNGAMSHTAFRTKIALKRWLNETGLKLGKKGWMGRSISLTGTYTRNCEMLNTKEFFNKYGHLEPFYALDNGRYSIGFIERKESGNVLHIQNVNTDRPELDYQKILTTIETGKKQLF